MVCSITGIGITFADHWRKYGSPGLNELHNTVWAISNFFYIVDQYIVDILTDVKTLSIGPLGTKYNVKDTDILF